MSKGREQLAALAETAGKLEGAAIDYWLFGGWAVDFYAGSVTRSHFDVDLAVWLTDVPRIVELLKASGWRHAPEPDEDGGTGYERGAVRLELTYLVRGDDGRVFIPLRSGEARWPEDSLGGDRGELDGGHARLVALSELVRTKSNPRDDPEDAEKDLTDATVLRRLVGAAD